MSTSDTSKKRLFVAIGLPEEIKKKLEEIQKQLRRFAIDAKWVKPEGIHLTLKFLGYVEQERIPQINNLLRKISLHYSFYPNRNLDPAPDLDPNREPGIVGVIQLKGLGFFPNARRPNVLWAGLVCPGIEALQQEMENELATIGFEKENRPFSPHLTLARFREPKGLIQLAQEAEKFNEVLLGEFQPTHFSLYQSVLNPHGAQYTVLESFGLKEK
jgi:RNA 2',3'-cyclic 3'-phosphodiesterase